MFGPNIELLPYSKVRSVLSLDRSSKYFDFIADSNRVDIIESNGDSIVSRKPFALIRYGKMDAYDAFISLNSGSRTFYNMVSNSYETEVLKSQINNSSFHSALEVNSDSTFLLLFISDASFLNSENESLFLISRHDSSVIRVTNYSRNHSSIKTKIPFKNEFRSYYDIQNPAHWITDSTFILGCEDGFTLYSITDLKNPVLLTDADVYSNFILLGGKVFYRTRDGIFSFNLDSKQTTQLVDDDRIFLLRGDNNFLFYSKGWSIYKMDCKSDSSEFLFKTSDNIFNFWLLDSGHIVAQIGRLDLQVEHSRFVHFSEKDKSSLYIDDSNALLLESYPTKDRKYFVFKKKTIQLKTYTVLTVYDYFAKKRYEIDAETTTQ